MKKTCWLLIAVLGCTSAFAQKPEKIYPFARHHYSVGYLNEQSGLWKKETEKNPRDAEAWYNYYYANRNLGFVDQSRTSKEKQAVIESIIDEMGKAIPDTYEYNIIRWMNGGWNMTLTKYLEKAQQLGPERPEHLDYSIIFAEMKGDIAARNKWSERKYEAGQFSTGLIYYNYNVLIGLPEKAILVTGGDNDTFPLWYLQSLGIRTDVTIVHTVLVNIPEYRNPIFRRLGIEVPASPALPGEGKNSVEDLIGYLSSHSSHPVYLALTANNCTKNTITENLYLTGLAYAHSKSPIDNIAYLKRNFELLYALDYIDRQFFPDISEDLVKIVNGNYVVPMLKLYDHYRTSGDTRQAERMKRLLSAVSKGTSVEEDVKKKLAQS
jgi:hypothetical protein